MTITQLKYTLAVAEHGNFTTASEKCFVTQPTLSMQVQKLEEELGITILIEAGHIWFEATPPEWNGPGFKRSPGGGRAPSMGTGSFDRDGVLDRPALFPKVWTTSRRLNKLSEG